MPQLDSLRALAFVGVAASHWLPQTFPLAYGGGTGVQLFFVLSGFLITGILLDYRRSAEESEWLSASAALRTFYARRFLRIFPLYYGVIAAALLLNLGPIRELWPWHVGYASNFLYGIYHPGAGDSFTHFWSLGVEEQFYLVWPFLVFFLPLKTVKWLISGLIVLAPIFRIGMHSAFPQFNRVNYFPFSCCDSLGIGACLAFATRHEFFRAPARIVASRMGVFGLCGSLVIGGVMTVLGSNFSLLTLGHTFLVLVFGWLVFRASAGFGGWCGTLLNRPELRYVGKISYGLYVYHNFFTRVSFTRFFQFAGLPASWSEGVWITAFMRLMCALVLASASWYFYEKPLNELKRYFTLSKQLAKSRPAAAVVNEPDEIKLSAS